MSITFNSNIIADLASGGVFGRPGGMGVHQLSFSVRYVAPSRKEIFLARNFRATVTVSRTQQDRAHLGIAWPENAWVLRTTPYTNNAAILFDLDLSSVQVELIEKMRRGGDLAFNLHFLCEVSAGEDVTTSADDVRFDVNKSAWISCMRQFGLDRIVLLEVDLPARGGEVETAASLLKLAREELDAGNYDGVVQQCRRAIESVQKVLKLKPAISAAVQTYANGDRTTMTKKARALLVNAAAMHYSHLAHHVDENGDTFEYGRRDAAFMLV